MNKNKILLVDNSDYRELLALLLRRSGYVVVEAATGLDALDQTHATHPDLILMDLCLPKMTGDEATAQLKADPSTRDIPVIVCTALHKGALTERAIAAGAVEILHKPIQFNDFLDVIHRNLIPGCGCCDVVSASLRHRPRAPPSLEPSWQAGWDPGEWGEGE